MKKLMMSIFIVTALASCSSENEIIDNGGIKGDERVEIKMRANILDVQTKAIINKGAAFTGTVFYSLTTNNYTSAQTAKVDFKTDGTGTLPTGTTWYYPIADTDLAYLCGYYSETSTEDAANNKVNFTIDGSNDIMFASQISGKRSESDTKPLTLTFNHKLTQIQLKAKKSSEVTDTDLKINSITVKTAKKTAFFDKATGKFDFDNDTKEDLSVPTNSLPSAALGTTTAETGTLLLAPETEYTLSIVTNKGTFDNVKIQPKAQDGSASDFKESTAHEITLTFSQKEVTPSAEVGEWKNGNRGETIIK